MNKIICTYASSSCNIEQIYFDAAYELGRLIAERQDILLFGGGLSGLMGATAEAVRKHHGKIIGVIPDALNVEGVVYHNCDELIITKDVRERKAVMDNKSDAFISQPGGYGTLEELLEIIALKQLGYHNKPIIILNINNYYNHLLTQFEHIVKQNFAKPECQKLYYITEDIANAIDYIDNYEPYVYPSRWLTEIEKKS